MRITVRFHGLLGKLCPGEHVVEANNAYEALRIVCRNNEKKLTRKNGHKFDCFCKQIKTQDDLYRRGGCSELDVMPAFAPAGGGSAKSAWIMTAIIVVIAIVCILTFGSGLALTTTLASGATTLTTTGSIVVGAAIATAGVWLNALSAHMQKKKKPDQNETHQNYAFGMSGNTTKVGTAIPIGYGRYRVYGQLLSWGTQTSESDRLVSNTNKEFVRRLNGEYISGVEGFDLSSGEINQW